MDTRADIPREGVTREDLVPRVAGSRTGRSSDHASLMIRSLFVAALTFVSLGTYYRATDETVRDRSVGSSRAELIRIARSSALFGANRMKESLAEKWIDQREAGAIVP